jgi:hypothetical protein
VVHHEDQEKPSGRRIELAEDHELRGAHREGETGQRPEVDEEADL